MKRRTLKKRERRARAEERKHLRRCRDRHDRRTVRVQIDKAFAKIDWNDPSKWTRPSCPA